MYPDTSTGVLIYEAYSRWKWPNIPGLRNFKGQIVHSAAWDHNYDYPHKRIGIIGNGSSAIQILPKMARLEGTQVTSFQRGPTWITPSLGSILGGQAIGSKSENGHSEAVNGEDGKEKGGDSFNPAYSKADIERFQDPEVHRAYRKMLQQGMNKGFRMVGPLLRHIPLLLGVTVLTEPSSAKNPKNTTKHSRPQSP